MSFDRCGGDESASERLYSNELVRALSLYLQENALLAKLGKVERQLEKAVEELLNDETEEFNRVSAQFYVSPDS